MMKPIHSPAPSQFRELVFSPPILHLQPLLQVTREFSSGFQTPGKNRKLLRSSWIWLITATSKGTAGTFGKATGRKLGLAFHQIPMLSLSSERLFLLATLFSMFIFSPENAKIIIQLLVFNAVCTKWT